MGRIRTLILGAAGRDFHNFNVVYRDDDRYEPHLVSGSVVYAGVDYADILAAAAAEADVILWDGGNNDLPFYRPALHIVVADPLRLGSELAYHPGEANLRMADVVVINKRDVLAPFLQRMEQGERVVVRA